MIVTPSNSRIPLCMPTTPPSLAGQFGPASADGASIMGASIAASIACSPSAAASGAAIIESSPQPISNATAQMTFFMLLPSLTTQRVGEQGLLVLATAGATTLVDGHIDAQAAWAIGAAHVVHAVVGQLVRAHAD